MDYVIRFESEAFDYRGTVPEDANAGNRFYGSDLADYLNQYLKAENYTTSVVDEDWGWLVTAAGQGLTYDVCLNNGLDGSVSSVEGPGTNGWSVYILTFAPRKVLGFGLGRKQIEPDKAFCSRIEAAISSKATRIVSSGPE